MVFRSKQGKQCASRISTGLQPSHPTSGNSPISRGKCWRPNIGQLFGAICMHPAIKCDQINSRLSKIPLAGRWRDGEVLGAQRLACSKMPSAAKAKKAAAKKGAGKSATSGSKSSAGAAAAREPPAAAASAAQIDVQVRRSMVHGFSLHNAEQPRFVASFQNRSATNTRCCPRQQVCSNPAPAP